MKYQIILFFAITILSAAGCSQTTKQKRTYPNLKHKQNLIVKARSTSFGSSMTGELQGWPMDSSSVEKFRKINKDSLYLCLTLFIPQENRDRAATYDHIKVIARDQVTGEEVVLVENDSTTHSMN